MSTKLTRNDKLLAKALVIGVTVDDIIAEFNAFDWMLLKDSDIEAVIEDFKIRTGFELRGQPLRAKAFDYKFEQAIRNLSALVEEVNSSYKIPRPKGAANVHISRYYYLKYWADKKHIPVSYNEADYKKRRLFNFYTILFDIFAENLANFNVYNAQKSKT